MVTAPTETSTLRTATTATAPATTATARHRPRRRAAATYGASFLVGKAHADHPPFQTDKPLEAGKPHKHELVKSQNAIPTQELKMYACSLLLLLLLLLPMFLPVLLLQLVARSAPSLVFGIAIIAAVVFCVAVIFDLAAVNQSKQTC